MNAEGIDVTEAESVFSLGELGLSKSKVDALENAGVDSDAEDSDAGDESESDDDDVDSEEEYEKMLDAQMEKLYDDYLTRRGDDVKTIKAVKRSKIAKRALAGEALVQDSTLFDGDAQAYQKMINPDEVRGDLHVVCCMLFVSPIRVICSGSLGTSAQLSNMGKIDGLPPCLTARRSSVRAQSFVHPTPPSLDAFVR